MKQTTVSDSQEPLRESDSEHKLDEETSGLCGEWFRGGSVGEAGKGRGHARYKQVKLCHLSFFPQIKLVYLTWGPPRDEFIVTLNCFVLICRRVFCFSL